MPIGRGDATSPYTVQEEDTVVEFTSDGSATIEMEDGTSKDTTVVKGGRYSLGGVKTVTFGGTFSIG